MSIKLVAVALLAAVVGMYAAQAQTVSQIGGPKELPPAGFKGMQFIDSRGCVFLRAGMGGTVTWVPRVGSNRKVLCGYPPTFGGKGAVAVVEAEPAPETPAVIPPKPAVAPTRMAQAIPEESYVPPPARVGKVVPTLPPMPEQSAPMSVAQAQSPLTVTVAPGASVAASEGRISCPASAPSLRRLPLTNGGTVLVCAPGNGELRGLRSPSFAVASVGAAFDDAPAASALRPAAQPLGQPSAARRAGTDLRVASAATAAAPSGFVPSWKDDRLNPLRGVGTAQGQAQQDQVWTRTVPAKLVGDTPRARRQAATAVMTGGYETQAPALLTVSTQSEPVARIGRYVQVGSFGVPSNAAGASARLAALGLPVAKGSSRGLTVVMAGPFVSPTELSAALRAARSAGFGDAFVR